MIIAIVIVFVLVLVVGESSLDPLGELLRRRVQTVADDHEKASEEEQAQKGYGRDHSKADPVSFGRVRVHQARDLNGKVACHEADGQEEDAELGEKRRALRQLGSGLRVLLRSEVEILLILVRICGFFFSPLWGRAASRQGKTDRA